MKLEPFGMRRDTSKSKRPVIAIKTQTRKVAKKADPNPPLAVISGIPSSPAPTVVPKTIKEPLNNLAKEILAPNDKAFEI